MVKRRLSAKATATSTHDASAPRRSTRTKGDASMSVIAGEEQPTKRARGSPSTMAKLQQGDDSDDYDEDEDGDDDSNDEAPVVTVIPLAKLRDTKGVDYEDDRVHPNTMLFLRDLKDNNTRPWLKSNDAEFRRSQGDWQTFVDAMTEKITQVDETVPPLPAKDLMFRIYRDTRFSNDPTPYKTHFSAAWSRTGKKGPYAHYYIQCEPGASFVAGGLWHPDGPQLAKLRASIDERPRWWREALMDPGLRDTFLLSASCEPSAAPPTIKKKGRRSSAKVNPTAEQDRRALMQQTLKAFVDKNKEGALKSSPRGFTTDHRDIKLLKLKRFTVSTKVDDTIFTGDDAIERLGKLIGDMVGFITHLNRIVMPDEEEEEEGEPLDENEYNWDYNDES